MLLEGVQKGLEKMAPRSHDGVYLQRIDVDTMLLDAQLEDGLCTVL